MPNTAESEPSLAIPNIPSPEQALKEVVAAQTSDAPSEPGEVVDPKAVEKYTFSIHHVDGAGRVWEGKFTNHILDYTERIQVGLVQARLTGAMPYAILDPGTLDLAEQIAHLSLSLDDKPRWFVLSGKDNLKNIKLLDKVYREVASHEQFFRGPTTAPETSES